MTKNKQASDHQRTLKCRNVVPAATTLSTRAKARVWVIPRWPRREPYAAVEKASRSGMIGNAAARIQYDQGMGRSA